eukprot:1142825-Pelagomonas_calceolata.AAC.6
MFVCHKQALGLQQSYLAVPQIQQSYLGVPQARTWPATKLSCCATSRRLVCKKATLPCRKSNNAILVCHKQALGLQQSYLAVPQVPQNHKVPSKAILVCHKQALGKPAALFLCMTDGSAVPAAQTSAQSRSATASVTFGPGLKRRIPRHARRKLIKVIEQDVCKKRLGKESRCILALVLGTEVSTCPLHALMDASHSKQGLLVQHVLHSAFTQHAFTSLASSPSFFIGIPSDNLAWY